MEMHQVRYFIAISRHLNFTKAAEECNVAQPSLTRAIQKLEDELGGPLFHRERANTHLTELGRQMLPHLERTYEAAQAAKDLAVSMRSGQLAPLRLGVELSVPDQPVMEILCHLRRSMAGVELTLGAGHRTRLIEEAREGAFDLIITAQNGEPPERLHCWGLFRQSGVLVLAQSHPLAARKSLTLDALDGQGLVLRPDCVIATALEEACAAAGVKPGLRHMAATEAQSQALILHGFGIGLTLAGTPLQSGLVALTLEDAVLERDVVLAAVAGRRFTPAANGFVRMARAADWSQAGQAG